MGSENLPRISPQIPPHHLFVSPRYFVGALAILILLMPARIFGQGGSSLITDDRDTPGPGFWEINLEAMAERSISERRTEQPLADINYGVGRRIQLKFEISWLHVRGRGESEGTGPGNANYGVKWRFLGEEGKRLAWSIYPQLEVNSSKSLSDRGLVVDGPQFLLPTEFTVETKHVEVNGELGRTSSAPVMTNGSTASRLKSRRVEAWSFWSSRRAGSRSRLCWTQFDLPGQYVFSRHSTFTDDPQQRHVAHDHIAQEITATAFTVRR